MENPYQTPQAIQTPEINTPLTFKQILFSVHGRIPRSTWWLYGILGQIACILPGLLLSAASPDIGAVVLLIGYIPAIWISIAVNAKRWHDRNKSGWWSLVGIIPLGGIWVLIECGILAGTPGNNQYGSNPLG